MERRQRTLYEERKGFRERKGEGGRKEAEVAEEEAGIRERGSERKEAEVG